MSEVAPRLAIEAHQLTKRFGKLVAVAGVELAVREGEIFGLLGPNGAGKTTVVRMLTGLLPITSGQAKVAGIDVRRDPDGVRRVLGVVPQALTSDLDLTGLENLDIYARFFDMGRERRPRIEALLHRVGLWDRRTDLVKTYSGGMRRRLEIARGLIHSPKVLFLDEPTMGLDPQSRHVIWDLLTELRRNNALTILLTTHYMDEADALCNRVAIVDNGAIAALGSPAELKSQVPGSDTVELSLSAPVPQPAVERVSALPQVRKVEQTRSGLRLHADGGAQLLPRALELLREQGLEVTAANVSRITLEDVFLHVTGRSLRAEASTPHSAAPMQRRFT